MDAPLYARMQEHSARHQHAIQLSVSAEPARNEVMHLELHLLSHVEVVELLCRVYREMRSTKNELEVLRREFRDLRNRFGTTLENLAAWQDELAPLLGLVHPQPDMPPDDDGPAFIHNDNTIYDNYRYIYIYIYIIFLHIIYIYIYILYICVCPIYIFIYLSLPTYTYMYIYIYLYLYIYAYNIHICIIYKYIWITW